IWRLPPGVKRANDAQKQDEEKETNGISCGREKRDLSSSLSPPVSSTASVPSPVQAPRGENCELNGEDRSRDATASSLSTSAGGGDENELKSPPRLAAYLNRTSAHSGRPWVDAVITDPPYGIRAGARQSGHQKKHKRTSERTNEERLTYISPTVLYEPQSVISDLMNLAARLLVDGGRLVFLLPVEVARDTTE
ncbi:methyltransferase-like related, partial [Cystoisospora suis]